MTAEILDLQSLGLFSRTLRPIVHPYQEIKQMINPANYRRVSEFLAHCENALLNTPKTIDAKRTRLIRLIQWSDDTPFHKCYDRPTSLTEYLVRERALANSTARSTLTTVREFFQWLSDSRPGRYNSPQIALWLNSLKIKKRSGNRRKPYRIYEVEKIAGLPSDSLTLLRNIATTVLGFLSGARVGALVTMPIKAVDLDQSPPRLRQWPSLGVDTKNSKTATTYLIPLETLLARVREWDDLVRSRLPEEALWYSSVTTDGMRLLLTTTTNADRTNVFRTGLQALCDQAGIPYRPPHQLRHGHAVYVNEHSMHPSRREAIQYNLMHEPHDVTGLYLTPPEDVIREVYTTTLNDGDQHSLKQRLALLTQELAQIQVQMAE